VGWLSIWGNVLDLGLLGAGRRQLEGLRTGGQGEYNFGL
jgi:hypothetical protein